MVRRIKAKQKPDRTDIHVGKNIRSLRIIKGHSQKTVAEAIGVSFQQVQKYEEGKNRISASTLYKFSKFFEVNMSDFFWGLEDEVSGDKQSLISIFHSMDKNTLELFLLFQSINSTESKQSLLSVLRSLTDKH